MPIETVTTQLAESAKDISDFVSKNGKILKATFLALAVSHALAPKIVSASPINYSVPYDGGTVTRSMMIEFSPNTGMHESAISLEIVDPSCVVMPNGNNRVNLREQPSTQSPIVGTITRDNPAKLAAASFSTGEGYNWYVVRNGVDNTAHVREDVAKLECDIENPQSIENSQLQTEPDPETIIEVTESSNSGIVDLMGQIVPYENATYRDDSGNIHAYDVSHENGGSLSVLGYYNGNIPHYFTGTMFSGGRPSGGPGQPIHTITDILRTNPNAQVNFNGRICQPIRAPRITTDSTTLWGINNLVLQLVQTHRVEGVVSTSESSDGIGKITYVLVDCN